MYSRSKLARKYLQYYFTASNGRGHGVHSPFVYAFIRDVLNDRRRYDAYRRVEKMRAGLLRDRRGLEIEDFGAGSALETGLEKNMAAAGSRTNPVSVPVRTRTVSTLARNAAKSRRMGQLLFRIAQYYSPLTILELGTSLGISTAYLAFGAPKSRVITIEGAPSVAAEAKRNFQGLGLTTIETLTGNFDKQLPSALERLPTGAGLVFVDGNHRREPTLRYFYLLIERTMPPAVLIFDDIHWSAEMEEAWEAIKADPRVMLTVDLFFIGLVFLREENRTKQHFVVRF